MGDQEHRGWEDRDPTDWQALILEHIITINHEMGEVVQDVVWLTKVVRIMIILIALLVLAQGEEFVGLLKRALDLLM